MEILFPPIKTFRGYLYSIIRYALNGRLPVLVISSIAILLAARSKLYYLDLFAKEIDCPPVNFVDPMNTYLVRWRVVELHGMSIFRETWSPVLVSFRQMHFTRYAKKELNANNVVFGLFRWNTKQFKAEVSVVKLRYE
jgi:hypothetical protein